MDSDLLVSAAMDLNESEKHDIYARLLTMRNNTAAFLDIIDSALNNISLYGHCNSDSDTSAGFIREVKIIYEQFLHYLYPLYSSLSALFGCSRSAKKLADACLEESSAANSISLNVFNNRLVIKIPLVPCKMYNHKRNFRIRIFEHELAALLDNAVSHGSVPELKRKFVSFVHVFPLNTIENLIPDNDNYDYKGIIDVITDKLGYGDNGCDCFLSMMSLRSSDLAPSSYIIVSNISDVYVDNVLGIITEAQ